MDEFKSFSAQAEAGVNAHCQSCGWTGDSTTAKQLANVPACPECGSALVLLDDDDPVDQ